MLLQPLASWCIKMSGKTLVQLENPTTQRTDAVEALAAFLHKPIEGGVLDLGNIKLVKSNKGDAFYGVTATKCSCPAATYHHGACKHQRKYFSVTKVERSTEAGSIRPDMRGFRPFDELPSERAAKASSSLSAIDCHDTTPLDVAYWSIQEDKTMWPAEA
jgi:metal-sulfur cluster biosynthetic enzyme